MTSFKNNTALVPFILFGIFAGIVAYIMIKQSQISKERLSQATQ
jgi:hypothetical protein